VGEQLWDFTKREGRRYEEQTHRYCYSGDRGGHLSNRVCPSRRSKTNGNSGVFNVPVSQADVGQDWNTRGYDCSILSVGSGWRSNNHVHRSDQVTTTVEGRVALVVGEQRFEAGPGDELFLPSNTMHRLENSHDGRLEMLYGLKHAVGAPPNRCD